MAAQPRSLGHTLLRFYKLTHQRLLNAAEELTPEQFAWSAGPSLHSVAWQLWHAARWDDIIASYFHRALAKDPRAQVWERESWRLDGPSFRNRWAGGTPEPRCRTRRRKRCGSRFRRTSSATPSLPSHTPKRRSRSYPTNCSWQSRRVIRMATRRSTTSSSTSST